MSKNKPPRLRVIPLGGLDGIGKNMTVIEYGDDMILVDAGIMFPDDDHPGVDLILPDYSYVAQAQARTSAASSSPTATRTTPARCRTSSRTSTCPCRFWARSLTLGLIKGKLDEHKIKKPKLSEVRDGGHMSLGAFGLDFFAVNHSIPDGVGVFIRTPVGTVLHTGDFKLDQTPIDGRLTDYGALTKFGKVGVTLLLQRLHRRRASGLVPLRGRGRQVAARHHRRREAARHRRLLRKPHPPAAAGVRRRARQRAQDRRDGPLDGARTPR